MYICLFDCLFGISSLDFRPISTKLLMDNLLLAFLVYECRVPSGLCKGWLKCVATIACAARGMGAIIGPHRVQRAGHLGGSQGAKPPKTLGGHFTLAQLRVRLRKF